jgi:hypothetical protein
VELERSALTELCREFDALAVEVRHHSSERQELLAKILAEAAARRPVLDLLSQLLGTERATTARALSVGLPGTGPGHARAETFRCPDGACDRREMPSPAGAIPRCAVTGRLMERG